MRAEAASSATAPPAVVARELSKAFGDFQAVDRASFEVGRGDIFGFLGPNGAGKTTTIRMLLGLIAPSGGRAEVLGLDVGRQARAVQQRIGYMSQRFSLYGDQTVAENLRFFGGIYGVSGPRMRQRQAYALEMTSLTGRASVLARDLAGGFRQRLALACAILHEPELLFLDEPTAGVDPISRRRFWDLLYDLAEQGRSIFVTTHYMDEAENCRNLAFIVRGRVVLRGTPAALQGRLAGQVLEIDSPDAGRALRALRQAVEAGQLPLRELALYGARIHAVAEDVAALEPAIGATLEAAGVGLRDSRLIAPSLEDVFIESVRGQARAAADPSTGTRP